jgi:hypothetical protein
MQGKRKHTNDEGDLGLLPGEYGWSLYGSCWYCCTPNGHMGNLSAHDVIEHDDGTITVSPSILVSDDQSELWHGYLERGVWREV